MGLIVKNASFLLLAFVFQAAFFTPVFQKDALAQTGGDVVISKSAFPSNDILPGQNVAVELRVPGGSSTLREPADIMLVMDRSGSMTGGSYGGTTKIQAAITAMNRFVDYLQEDTGPTGPGDFVGFATYASTLANNAELNHPIANLTSANETLLRQRINSICYWGAPYNFYDCGNALTPIGAGLQLAFQELTNQTEPASTSRAVADTKKYIVMATDGQHNRGISPYDPAVMAQIIANNIPVYTIGIGNDVTSQGVFQNCAGCPDLNGNGLNSGEELMRAIACDTDPNCIKAADGILNGRNDYEQPAHYYYAADANDLEEVYEDIADVITTKATYQLVDAININGKTTDANGDGILDSGAPGVRIYDGIVGPFSVVDCATGAPWPNWVKKAPYYTIFPTTVYSSFIIQLNEVGTGEEVCIRFNVRVATTAISGSFPVDEIGMTSVWDPARSCGSAIQCLLLMYDEPHLVINNFSINIVTPFDPWLQLEGDIGSIGHPEEGSIDPVQRNPFNPISIPGGLLNNSFLSIGDYNIHSNFRSLWTIENYTTSYDGIKMYIPGYDMTNPTRNIYNSLLAKYSKSCSGGAVQNISPFTASGVKTAVNNALANNGCNIVRANANALIPYTWNYDGPPAVVFVNGFLRASIDINIASNTGLIFVVNGNIIFQTADVTMPGANDIDGIYISQGNIYTSNQGEESIPQVNATSTHPGDDQLTINGALYSFGSMFFTRNLATAGSSTSLEANNLTPAERIIFDPKYMFLFANQIGDKLRSFNEEAP